MTHLIEPQLAHMRQLIAVSDSRAQIFFDGIVAAASGDFPYRRPGPSQSHVRQEWVVVELCVIFLKGTTKENDAVFLAAPRTSRQNP
jgi:hypothetical protein